MNNFDQTFLELYQVSDGNLLLWLSVVKKKIVSNIRIMFLWINLKNIYDANMVEVI